MKVLFTIVVVSLQLLLTGYIVGAEIPKTPFLKNYSKHDYNARTQNWAITQSDNNIMYFANNQGVLQFDGINWEVIEMPNKSIVRSMIYLGGDTILAGAYSELGIVYHDNKGELVYESWLDKIPKEYQNFNEIWRIHKMGRRLIIQTFSHILILENEEFVKAILPKNTFKFSFQINESIYVQQTNLGLYQLINEELVLVNDGIFKDLEIWTILPFDEKRSLVGTQFKGFYLFDGQNTIPWETEANEFIIKNNLYSSVLMSKGNYAFGSIQNGLIIVNRAGHILSIQNTSVGLQNNTILSLFEDNTQNLWLGLDNGIDFIKTNSPLSYVRKRGGFGTGYTSIIFNNTLYAGTNQGLYYIPLGSSGSERGKMNDFEIVESTRGQVWCLRSIDSKLYCGHNQGLFIINGNRATQIGEINGVWDVVEIPNETNDLLVGSYEGFYLLSKKNNTLRKIKGFEESSRHYIFQKNGNVLLSHGYKGIFELKLDIKNESMQLINFFNGTNQLPNDFGNEVIQLKNEILISTDSGIYTYKNNRLEYDVIWDALFENGAKGVSKIIEGDNSKFWCFKDSRLTYITFLNEKMFELNTKDFLSITNTFPKGYENILRVSNDSYLIGNEDGFVLYESTHSNTIDQNIKVDVSSVQFKYKGENSYNRLEFFKKSGEILIDKVEYKKHRMKIELSQPYFTDQNLVEFRYKINGGPWFGWLAGNELKLDDLTEGNYLINVQSSVDQKNIAGELSIKFTIEPPLFRRWYSYIMYLFVFFTIALLSSWLIKKRIENEKRRESLKQKKKMIEKQIQLTRRAEQAQNELIGLRNEKLKNDIIHKSKELANTTMSLIHKNKILQQFIDVLTDLRKEDTKFRENAKINHLIKKINKEIEHQDNWAVFEKNFDKVHENFLQRLMSNHSDLTPKDLRLAAYLRMNLSSKEIAPLLNISIRSVEISRYRLRKKMNLGHDQNLTEYLLAM